MRHRSSELHRFRGSCRSRGTYVLLLLAAVLVAGCGIGSERVSPLEMKVRDLEQEKARLAGQLEQCRVETEQVKAQVKALAV
jgi:cell division protein FtsB